RVALPELLVRRDRHSGGVDGRRRGGRCVLHGSTCSKGLTMGSTLLFRIPPEGVARQVETEKRDRKSGTGKGVRWRGPGSGDGLQRFKSFLVRPDASLAEEAFSWPAPSRRLPLCT